MASDVTLEQRTVRFSGRVQGVGFRYATQKIAERHPVSGFVQNEAGGEVLLVVEGPRSAIEALLNDVRIQFDGFIRGEKTSSAPRSGNYSGFEIRRP